MEVRPSSEQSRKTAQGGGDEAKILIDGETDFLALPPFSDSLYLFPSWPPAYFGDRDGRAHGTGSHTKQIPEILGASSLSPVNASAITGRRRGK